MTTDKLKSKFCVDHCTDIMLNEDLVINSSPLLSLNCEFFVVHHLFQIFFNRSNFAQPMYCTHSC